MTRLTSAKAHGSKPVPLPEDVRPRRVVGLDLGQQADYSALALLEWAPTPKPVHYRCRTLKRWPLGTLYQNIVEDLVKFFATPDLYGAVLAIDQTGVGRPVYEMVRGALLKAKSPCRGSVGITITAGSAVTQTGEGTYNVAKKQLVSCMQVLLARQRLHVSTELPLARTLMQELLNFKVKITDKANETFESWRDGDHDDLVLAVALAAWVAATLPHKC